MNTNQNFTDEGIGKTTNVAVILKLVKAGLLSVIVFLLTTTLVPAQVGMVQSFQKISTTTGGFLGTLDSGERWGGALSFIGDIDGDGLPELAVGAPLEEMGGAVWILFLHPNGTVKNYQKISATTGGFTGQLDDNDFFGWTVAAIGDRDGDGTPDLAVGAPLDDDGGPERGALWILYLHPNGTVKTHQKINHQSGVFTGMLDDADFFGISVADLGDLDGDGVSDLAVGALGDDDGGTDRGAVWVLFLDSSGTVKNHQKISATAGGFTGTLDDGDAFGISVAILGDLDGDGVPDVVVGAPADDDGGTERGAMWVLFLDASGTVKNHQKISATAGGFTGILDDNDLFGISVTALGDLDGDGTPDLVVGAPGDGDGGTEKGAVWELFMAGTGMVKFHQKISEETGHFTGTLNALDWFGWSVGMAEDLNGDKIPDIAVGAPSQSDRGSVWIFHLNGKNE
ncbi:MAG: integrin alpha [Nitrospirales bacterium]|nr:integrin alpha [Nitrospirales bacterium]